MLDYLYMQRIYERTMCRRMHYIRRKAEQIKQSYENRLHMLSTKMS